MNGTGIFDGPSDAASIRAIAAWHANFIRLLLNEDCWLGINGVAPAFSGRNYRRAIIDYVQLIHRYGMYVEVSLAWAAPGRYLAITQPQAPDEDHSPAAWASMAAAFKHDSAVLLAPWSEPTVDARCFLHGGRCGATYNGGRYAAAGMQQAVRTMRAAGFRGPIAIPGLHWADDLTQWLAYEPRDPLHQLVAEAHVYGNNGCGSTACLDTMMTPVARRVPLIFSEVGETFNGVSCSATYIPSIFGWIDAHGAGYAAWTWDAWAGCEALISTYKGRPGNSYGAFVKTYYAQHAATTYRLVP